MISNNIVNNYHGEISNLLNLEEAINTEIVILNSLSTADIYNSSIGGFVNLINNKIYLLNENSLKYMSEEEIESYEKYMGTAPNLDDTTFEVTVAHEYTHKLTIDLMNKYKIETTTLPTWFYEGIAVYSENMYMKKDMPLTATRLGNIKDNGNFSGMNAPAYYKRAGIFINYLIQTYGEDIIANLAKNMDENTDIYKALEKVTEKNFDELIENIY